MTAPPDLQALVNAQAQKVVDAVTKDESGSMVAGQWMGGNGGLLSRSTIREVELLRRALLDLARGSANV